MGGPNDGYAGWRGEASAEPNAGGLVGLLAVALVASSQVASAAPKDKIEVLDGATLDDLSREPEPVPGAFSMLDRSERGIATKLRKPVLAPVTARRCGT